MVKPFHTFLLFKIRPLVASVAAGLTISRPGSWEIGIMTMSHLKKNMTWISLLVQWLRICLAMQRTWGSLPALGTKVPHAEQLSLQHLCRNYCTRVLRSPCTTTRASAPQGKTLHDATKILLAATKTQCPNKYFKKSF